MVTILYLACQTKGYSIFPTVDDYSHWATKSRIITVNDRLINGTDKITAKDYPSNVALFHYYFTHFTGFKENVAIFSNGLFILILTSTILTPLKAAHGEKFKTILVLSVLSILSLIWILGQGLHTLQVDLILGVSFGASLSSYFNSQQKSKTYRFLLTFPLIIFMTQTKQIGILFSLFAIILITTDYLLPPNKFLKNKLLIISGLSLSIILITKSWELYLESNSINKTFQVNISITNIFSAFDPQVLNSHHSETIKNFINYIFFQHHLSTYWFLLTLITLAAIFKEKKMLFTSVQSIPYIGVYIAFSVYMLTLLLLYLFSFSAWEGVRLASIDRYTITFLLGMLIFFGSSLIFTITTHKKIENPKFILFIVFLFIFPNLGRLTLDSYKTIFNLDSEYTAGEIKRIADFTLKKIPTNSSVYFIWTDGTDDHSVIFNYFMNPRKTNTNCSSIKPSNAGKDPNDPWSCHLSLQEFNAKIIDYDYLLIAHASDNFWKYFLADVTGNIGDVRLFHIVNDGEITLHEI